MDIALLLEGAELAANYLLEGSGLSEQPFQMLIFYNRNSKPVSADFAEILTEIVSASGAAIYGLYQGQFIALFSGSPYVKLQKNMQNAPQQPELTAIFTHIRDIKMLRDFYTRFASLYPVVEKIMPYGKVFPQNSFDFAEMCVDTEKIPGDFHERILYLLQSIRRDLGENDLFETLSVYLLDADCDVQKTADLLFVHKNTVKYRLHRISEYFGFPVGKMHATYPIYLAVGINRL